MKGYVAVVGGANLDITGTPDLALSLHDSAPGRISVGMGGVGRNIAQNLAGMGLKVSLITVFGTDPLSAVLKEDCKRLGMDISHSLTVEGATSSYLCLNDHAGEMQYALAGMGIMDAMTPEFLAGQLDFLNGASAVVVDTNLPAILDFVMDRVTAPLFLDTVSVAKAGWARGKIKRLAALKTNALELAALTGLEVTDFSSAEEAAKGLLKGGVERVFVTMGAQGVWFSDGLTSGSLPATTHRVVNTTGCGDSFAAGVIYAHLRGASVERAAELGSMLATATLGVPTTVCPREVIRDIVARWEE
ncbi:MAG: carbohydrate kinase family protein [Clostridia bacterium]|nr:carbohydrate kinase family protein [Clostridia bacterium]